MGPGKNPETRKSPEMRTRRAATVAQEVRRAEVRRAATKSKAKSKTKSSNYSLTLRKDQPQLREKVPVLKIRTVPKVRKTREAATVVIAQTSPMTIQRSPMTVQRSPMTVQTSLERMKTSPKTMKTSPETMKMIRTKR